MSLDDLNLEYLLNNACRIAREAGDRIMEIYDEGFQVEQKSDRTPLTEADMAAHRHIVAGLRDLSPCLPILSEESDRIPFSERARWQTYWLVDPLDGTREFIKRNGEFTVNIALIHEHEPVLGVVAAPALDRLYSAARGMGAHRHEPAATVGERIQVNRDRRTKPVIAGSRSHGTERMQQFLERVGEHELVSMGSSLKFCLVAEGKADLYPRLGPTSEWDTAAAQCVVHEAGGVVTDLHLSPLRYNTHEGILNPEFLVMADPTRGWERHLPD
ncbi:3'(2'),5'-bisphosphate nucleotidase CysQ [Ectothiorhodospira shaposhnikovii]|uniref:3'(2'),5'-bisphosphate nucleotidase CysQ n=1 Tax=Ectothiorhodospira shaposhnikovii TaxID=1054 RepID=UPI001EE96D3D|nr:3'(2'),5'-bisphosphate nucleotidase CysQ [Ectothiorhodospira shaposhnikovii]MCG5512300.1 3'(2'),5'-bisphosphate nucleotidase CysQ [Ectothiorhodospira shaposhnikovii]